MYVNNHFGDSMNVFDARKSKAVKVGKMLYNNGYKVAVSGETNYPEELDLPKFPNPRGCGEENYRLPDVYARKGNKEIVVEVESDSVSRDRTRCQLKTFRKHSTGKVWVYVPSGYRRRMKRNLKIWGISDVKVKTW